MARGWESKDVESQIEQASSGKSKGVSLTSGEAARLRECEHLKLSLRELRARREKSANAAYQAQLDRAIEEVKHRIKKLECGKLPPNA